MFGRSMKTKSARHSTTGTTPYERMFGRSMKTKLHTIFVLSDDQTDVQQLPPNEKEPFTPRRS
ncbi:hypothetical protein HZS_6026 [Henneguya salminicola]|nr:hypothetical protein HZS_6026 [Henneguya salminicola]